MIRVPEALRNHAVAAGAERWLADLPELVNHLEQQWDLTLGRPLAGATEAYVAEVTTGAGQPAVLKVLLPLSGGRARHEITALRLADGRGCVALLRDDPDLGALLLERLGPPLYELGLPTAQRHEILVDTAAKLWRPAPDSGLPTGADRARHLATFVTESWQRLDRPCSERAIDYALACAHRRAAAHDDERAVLVHGDVHQLNALQAGPEFKLVDPDGLLAEPECDLGTVMRGDPVELLQGDPRERARRLGARSGLDATAIWEWGVIERVASGLHCTEIEVQPLGRQTLAAAEAVAGPEPA
ncbi:aminoglycoside phosphotransferase family protein [Microlunatus speluncae]|uniref:aminoglycoside phosphotransferase family protein n=1 Tax=Microlunatus speluncae TaxID=2594267 RepID=UPI0012666EA4|nr:aminoglycoside phosphotransferase family protein [Microlunatus speluncae]